MEETVVQLENINTSRRWKHKTKVTHLTSAQLRASVAAQQSSSGSATQPAPGGGAGTGAGLSGHFVVDIDSRQEYNVEEDYARPRARGTVCCTRVFLMPGAEIWKRAKMT